MKRVTTEAEWYNVMENSESMSSACEVWPTRLLPVRPEDAPKPGETEIR